MKRLTSPAKVTVLTFILGVLSVLLWFFFKPPINTLHNNVMSELPENSNKTEIPEVPFCHVVSKPENFAGKLVRLKGVYSFGLHGALIGDQNCSSLETQTWVKFEPKMKEELDHAIERAYSGENRYPSANLTAVGKFEKNNPTNSSDIWQDTVPYRFELVEIIAVERAN